eukprot:scaffold3939_cov166-Amphora_coffeaeformis.AAC.12
MSARFQAKRSQLVLLKGRQPSIHEQMHTAYGAITGIDMYGTSTGTIPVPQAAFASVALQTDTFMDLRTLQPFHTIPVLTNNLSASTSTRHPIHWPMAIHVKPASLHPFSPLSYILSRARLVHCTFRVSEYSSSSRGGSSQHPKFIPTTGAHHTNSKTEKESSWKTGR